MRVFFLLLVLAPLAFAKKAKWECSTTGAVETCNLFLEPSGFTVAAKDVRAASSQEQENWCWLASIEMSFRYYGYIVPQERLLDLLWGNIQDMPGGAEQIIGATNRVYTDDHSKRFRAESKMLGDWLEVSNYLAKDFPVLVGYGQPGGIGHMTMILGVQIQALYNPQGQVVDSRVSDVLLWDPWPGAGVRNMTQAEFDNTFILVAVGATDLGPVVAVRCPAKAGARPFIYLPQYNILGRRLPWP